MLPAFYRELDMMSFREPKKLALELGQALCQAAVGGSSAQEEVLAALLHCTPVELTACSRGPRCAKCSCSHNGLKLRISSTSLTFKSIVSKVTAKLKRLSGAVWKQRGSDGPSRTPCLRRTRGNFRGCFPLRHFSSLLITFPFLPCF